MGWISGLMIINITFKDKRWVKIPLEEIGKGALKLIIDKFLGQDNNFEVSILASDDVEIRELNKNFRRIDSSTNIISWPEHETQLNQPGHIPDLVDKLKSGFEGLNFLGNLAISFDRCSIEAEEKNIHFEDHVLHLLLHGCLHLIGFDHQNELDANLMEDIEIRLLSGVGIKNPYELND
jgi:probable rRNA maturation factor